MSIGAGYSVDVWYRTSAAMKNFPVTVTGVIGTEVKTSVPALATVVSTFSSSTASVGFPSSLGSS